MQVYLGIAKQSVNANNYLITTPCVALGSVSYIKWWRVKHCGLGFLTGVHSTVRMLGYPLHGRLLQRDNNLADVATLQHVVDCLRDLLYTSATMAGIHPSLQLALFIQLKHLLPAGPDGVDILQRPEQHSSSNSSTVARAW